MVDVAKATNRLDDMMNAAKAMDKADDVMDAAKALDKADDAMDAAKALDQVKVPKLTNPIMRQADDVATHLDDALKKFDPKTATNKQKGNFGEIKSHNHKVNNPDLRKKGYDLKRIGNDPPEHINANIRKGIDGIYGNATPPPKYVIDEAKYGTSQLNKKTGQVSEKWIEDRLKKQFANDPEKLSDILRSLRKGEVDKVLSKIDELGNVTTKKIDKLGKIISNWP